MGLSAGQGVSAALPSIEHVITGLQTGGAELTLQRLLNASNACYRQSVTSLLNLGDIGVELRRRGVAVRTMNLKGDARDVWGAVRLAYAWKRRRPDIVQTWLYHSDLIGGLAARAAGVPVVWNIRQSNLDPAVNKPSTLRIVGICARLSGWLPSRIICGSEAARIAHEKAGFNAGKLTVIPNGFDLDVFRPDRTARPALGEELAIPGHGLLVGRIGRFDPQKDHRTFVEAAPRIAAAATGAYFLMAGQGITWDNAELAGWIHETGLADRFRLLGKRDDLARLNAALDLAVSSSVGEGFPNVVGEAMASGVVCVVTDVGDSSRIVGDTGRVVPPRDPAALGDACARILGLSPEQRSELGQRARGRIREHYNLPEIVRSYERLYSEVLESVRNRRLH